MWKEKGVYDEGRAVNAWTAARWLAAAGLVLRLYWQSIFRSWGQPNSSKNASTTPFDQPKPVCNKCGISRTKVKHPFYQISRSPNTYKLHTGLRLLHVRLSWVGKRIFCFPFFPSWETQRTLGCKYSVATRKGNGSLKCDQMSSCLSFPCSFRKKYENFEMMFS